MPPVWNLQKGHLTVNQKGPICKKAKESPSWCQERIAVWAEKEFHRAQFPNQGTISRVLSQQARFQAIPKHLWAVKRLPSSREPVLDCALAGWVLQKQVQKAMLTEDLIKENAKSFAQKVALENPPRFSNG
jgi:hypothetical protein